MNGLARLILVVIRLSLFLMVSTAARAEVVVVVSVNSGVQALGKNEIVDLFLSRKIRFPDGQLAVPIDLEVGAPEREEFYAAFVGLSPAKLAAHWSAIIFTGRGKPPRTVANGLQARKLIAANTRAIGYIDRNLVDDSVRVLGK